MSASALFMFVGLVGAVLGMRYSVLSLVPVFILLAAGVALVGLVRHAPAAGVLADVLVVGLVLQAGYLAGVVANHLMVCARAQSLALPRRTRAAPAVEP
ncbi:hypothetical protein [Rhodoplanes roseus]|uniref:Uncharacterized protein n=1 Tax=Rhodoplanes roseus TaxID=29409 RepID=A0A327KXH2_9BRAD|nr:hypothetical protein [Rhodoplanes roseus]RAI42235.1 hypothetical protein CH341_20055 [Rhodoplanes roseus]